MKWKISTFWTLTFLTVRKFVFCGNIVGPKLWWWWCVFVVESSPSLRLNDQCISRNSSLDIYIIFMYENKYVSL